MWLLNQQQGKTWRGSRGAPLEGPSTTPRRERATDCEVVEAVEEAACLLPPRLEDWEELDHITAHSHWHGEDVLVH